MSIFEHEVVEETVPMADLLPETPGPCAADPVVDIVIPVHNEAHVLEASVTRLYLFLRERFPLSWRVTIVDNASTDDTWRVARRLTAMLRGVTALHLDRKGRGLALRTAWAGSDARVVAYMDVDLSTDLSALLPLVAPLVSGHSDVAIGSRLASASQVARGPKRELISRSYNLILRTVFGTAVRDAQCGFKAVRADVARALLPSVSDDGWFFDTELLLLAERNGLRIHQVPVDWVDDPDSRVDLQRTVLEDLRGVWRLARAFSAGQGYVELGGTARPVLADDMGRQLVTFASIGVVSSLVSMTMFVLLRPALGAGSAAMAALGATAFGNLWANRRWTFGRRDPHGRLRYYTRSGLVLVAGIALSLVVLALVERLGGGVPAELAALVVTWSATMALRFRLLRTSAFPAAAHHR
jgi:putative flippase GtrA